MFSTEANHFFQSFDSQAFFWFMSFISALGVSYAIIFQALLIVFGIEFRRGWLIFNFVAWTAIFTLFLKNFIDYPRPLAVDPSLNAAYSNKNTEDLTGLQPDEWFETFTPKLLEKVRVEDLPRYGFPSGHTSMQISLWLGMALLFRSKKWLWWAATFMILATMVSRLYLAHHYLGDVIGGFLLGTSLTFVLFYWGRKVGYHTEPHLDRPGLYFLLLPLILFLVPLKFPLWQAATLIGFNLSMFMHLKKDTVPRLCIEFWRRLVTVIIIFVIYGGFYYIGNDLIQTGSQFLDLLIMSIINFGVFHGAMKISYKVKCMEVQRIT